jgi:hypothetical protein
MALQCAGVICGALGISFFAVGFNYHCSSPREKVLMRKFAVACVTLLLLAGCSSSNPTSTKDESQSTAKPAPKQPEYKTGRVAFQEMYLSARGWAADATPFRLQSQFAPEAPTSDGKAGLWRASFASPAKRMMKMFVWSGLVGADAPEPGITFSAEDTWNPTNASTRPFNIGFLKIDSDAAYQVAQKNGGDKLLKKDPKQPVVFILDWDASKNQLVWHVIYGSSPDEAKLRVAVDAATGEFLRVEK